MTLFLYLVRRFLLIFASLTLGLGVFFALVTMVELTAQLGKSQPGFSDIFGLTLLRLPGGLYQILPLIVILSTVTMFLSLARSSELVAIRSAGRAGLAMLLAPALAALLLGIFALAVGNPIVAATNAEYDIASSRFQGQSRSVLSLGQNGIWLRQGDNTGQVVIRADRSNNEGSGFLDVSFLGFGPDTLPTFRIEAQSAELMPGEWVIRSAKRWDLRDGDLPEASATFHDVLTLPSNLTVDKVREGFGNPATTSIWELPAFIEQLQLAGFSARRHLMWYHLELSQPAMLVAMVLLSAAFTMRPQRFGHTGAMVMIAVGLGFAAYFLRNLVSLLGENGQLPIVAAAYATPAALILLALGVVMFMEDG